MSKRLYRSRVDCKIGGVCAGLAEYFDIDPTIIRITAILLILAHGIGVLAYIIAWIAIPRQPLDSPVEVIAADTTKVEKSGEKTAKNMTLPGIILIVVGILFLFEHSYWWFNFGNLWPILLIIIGILMLIKHGKKEHVENNSGGEVNQ